MVEVVLMLLVLILVEKLGLKCDKHLNPYRLWWLNDNGEVKVSR